MNSMTRRDYSDSNRRRGELSLDHIQFGLVHTTKEEDGTEDVLADVYVSVRLAPDHPRRARLKCQAITSQSCN